MKVSKITFLTFLGALLILFYTSRGPTFAQQEGGVIEILLEHGIGTSTTNTPQGGIRFPIICEGNTSCQDHTTYTEIEPIPGLPGNQFDFTATVQITRGTSSLTATDCLFRGHSLEGEDPIDPSSGNIPFTFYMTGCAIGSGTGRYAPATSLEFRGKFELHDQDLALSNSSTYWIKE